MLNSQENNCSLKHDDKTFENYQKKKRKRKRKVEGEIISNAIGWIQTLRTFFVFLHS